MPAPDSNAVTAKPQPSDIFHNPIRYAVNRINSTLVHRCHNITAFMEPVSSKGSALSP